jgi:hypothetical protein
MTTKDELIKAMEGLDFTGGEVVTEQRQATSVFSFRAPSEWNDEIITEMERRGLKNPNQLMKRSSGKA